MIIAINPMLSNTQLNSDSNYVYLRELLTKIIEKEPSWLFYIFWPSGTEWKYYDDGFFPKHSKNIIRVPKRWQEGKYRAGCDYDVGFFYEWFASHPYHLIWNNTPEQTPVFLNLRVQSSETWKPAVVNFHHFPAHKSLPGVNENYIGVQALQSIGTALGDYNVYNSKHCQKMNDDLNRQFLNVQMMDKIKQSSHLFYMGPINEPFPETTDYSQPVFLYNHRIAGYKNWDETFGFFDKFWEEGHKFKVLVTTVDTSQISRVSSRPYVQAFNCFTREQYLSVLPKANINISNSQHETFCISMVESMAAGHVPMGPNKCTFPELFENEVSGLIFRNEDEQYLQIRRILTEPELRQRLGFVAKKRARTVFSSTQYAENVIRLFTEIYDKTYYMPETSKLAEIEQAMKDLPAAKEFMPAYRQVQKQLGWMNQAYPIPYFVFTAEKFGRKFTVKNNQVWVVK